MEVIHLALQFGDNLPIVWDFQVPLQLSLQIKLYDRALPPVSMWRSECWNENIYHNDWANIDIKVILSLKWFVSG